MNPHHPTPAASDQGAHTALPLFTEQAYDGVKHYSPTKEADELFIQFVCQDHVEHSTRSESLQREAFMAGLLHLHLDGTRNAHHAAQERIRVLTDALEGSLKALFSAVSTAKTVTMSVRQIAAQVEFIPVADKNLADAESRLSAARAALAAKPNAR